MPQPHVQAAGRARAEAYADAVLSCYLSERRLSRAPSWLLVARLGTAWQPELMTELTADTIGHVRVLRLNRPERKNALTSSLGWSIVRAVAEAQADDNVRVVALTGSGDAFCSGLDLAGGDDGSPETGLSEQEWALDETGWVGRFLLALRFETSVTS